MKEPDWQQFFPPYAVLVGEVTAKNCAPTYVNYFRNGLRDSLDWVVCERANGGMRSFVIERSKAVGASSECL